MPHGPAALHGRAAECATLDTLLVDARHSRSRCLVLRGEPGVGKSALIAYAVDHAPDLQVLRSAGAPAESGLAFAGLHRLLRPLLGGLGALPEPQAGSLAGALGLATAPEPDRFLVGLAVLSLLSDREDERPLLCVVDDAQWLDAETSDALAFAARRLDAEGVALLVAGTELSSAGLGGTDLPVLDVVGLDRVASDALLVERSPGPPAPQVLDALWKLTHGNPLALVELSSGLDAEQLSGRVPLPDDVRLGVALQHTLQQRADRLPESTRTILLVAAAEGTGDLGLVLRAADLLGADAAALEPAELAGLVRVADGRIDFPNPLMRTAVYHGAPFGRRHGVHRALAGCLGDEVDADRRTWHRSAATVGPDDEVARELAASAGRARQRGGHAAASAALERAADLAVDPEDAGRLLVEAADDAWLSGRAPRTTALLDRADPLVSDVVVRADVDLLRGLVEAAAGDRRAAYAVLLAGAEPVATLAPTRAARLLLEAGRVAWSDADLAGVMTVGVQLGELDLPASSPESYDVGVLTGLSRLIQGDAAAAAPMLRAAVAAADRDDPRQLQLAGAASMFSGDEQTAADLFTRAMARARAIGAVSRLPDTLATLASLEVWSGEFATARAHAVEGAGLAAQTGQEHFVAHFDAVLAWIAAAQGRVDDCKQLAGEALELGAAHRVRPPVALATWALALSDMGAGRWSEATTRLAAVAAPHSLQSHPVVALLAASDLVEAASRVDRADLAGEALARLEAFAGPMAAAWTLALVARGRALLAPDAGAAEALYEEALARHAEAGRRFDEARTRLLHGELLRRARRRTDARTPLRAALDTFERLGAEPWADRARAELRATGETARRRDPSTLSHLTPQQSQIVRLVADGASNKEVAAQLFLSTRTVDYHLRNVFVKLGINSRAELAKLAANAP